MCMCVLGPVLLMCMHESMYHHIKKRGNHIQNVLLKLDYLQLNIALVVCSSGQEFPDLLSWTEPSAGCMRNTSRFLIVIHRASISVNKESHSAADSGERPGMTHPRQEQPGNHNTSSFSSRQLLTNLPKTAFIKNKELPLFDLVLYLRLCMCTGGYICVYTGTSVFL